jgi:hypothetical protein
MNEDQLQASIVAWLRIQHPTLLFFAVPNGGNRSAREGAKLKRTGTLAGVADLVVILSGGRAGFIEVKLEGKYQQPAQKAFQAHAEGSGAYYAVARSIEDVREILEEWGE